MTIVSTCILAALIVAPLVGIAIAIIIIRGVWREVRESNAEREDVRAAMEDTFGPESWQ